MAVYDPQTIHFKCSYQPCGYEEDVHFFNKDIVDTETRFCPKCNLFTLKANTFEYFKDAGIADAMKELWREQTK